jgi:hypothetical protein
MAEIAQQPGSGSPAPSIDDAKRQKLLELVRGRAMARPTDLADDEVMVWPSLVVIEAVSATVFLLILTLLSVFISAPLTEMANPNHTPNPAKAPWYFLNLQELLLHMDAGLAGVIIPTIALAAIAAIPYIDRSPMGVGILGTSSKGRRIAGFSAIFTAVVVIAMVYLDEQTNRTQFGIGRYLARHGASEFITKQVVPTIILIFFIALLGFLIKVIYRPTTREMIIALFTGFYVSYWVLTIIGTSFRGPSQTLVWPWNLPLTHH